MSNTEEPSKNLNSMEQNNEGGIWYYLSKIPIIVIPFVITIPRTLKKKK